MNNTRAPLFAPARSVLRFRSATHATLVAEFYLTASIFKQPRVELELLVSERSQRRNGLVSGPWLGHDSISKHHAVLDVNAQREARVLRLRVW